MNIKDKLIQYSDLKDKGEDKVEIEELLQNYNIFIADIKTKEYKIKELELEEISINGSNFSINGDIRPQGYMASNFENKIIENQDKILVFKKEIEEMQAKVNMIDSLINTLNDYHRRIVELKYKYNKSDIQIAVIVCREDRTIRKAIKKILSILDVNYKKFRKSS